MPHVTVDPAVIQRTVDQRVILRELTWSDYEALLAIRGEKAGVRIAYLEGTLELMTPSLDHEMLKTKLARLIEAYAVELGLELEGIGSWTLKREELERGLEPDECYSIGLPRGVPDLAIEVIWTSGGLDKLEIYRRLGVREVWIWQKDAITIFGLHGDRYERCERSEVLPQIDIDLICSLLDLPTQTAAVRELQTRLRGESTLGRGRPA
jgi:Uma2 family endonuclease